jgi:DNA polymerase I
MQLLKTKEQVQESLFDILTSPWAGFDLETTGLDPKTDKILLVSLSTDQDTYVLDFTQLDISLLQEFRPLFESAFIIGANITFDYRFLFWHTGIKLGNMTDVMVNEQVLTAGKFIPPVGKARPFSLAAIAHRRLGVTLDKDVREEFINYNGTLSEEAFIYAGQDTAILKAIYDQQLAEIAANKLERIHDLENRLLAVTAHMELAGVLIDREKLQQLEPPIERYIETCSRVLQDLIIANGAAQRIVCGKTYSAINVGSKPQVLEAFNLLGINIDSLEAKVLAKWDLRRNKETLARLENLLRTDEADIQTAIEEFGGYNNPYLRAYAFLIGAEKLLGTYVKGMQEKIHADGKFYPWFRQCGARSTGRYSSNAQQIPKNDKLDRLGLKGLSIRECFIAPKGRKLIIADFSAIELVILADLSGDKRLTQEILHGDIHIVVTQEVLGTFFPIAKDITSKNRKQHPFDILRDFSKTFSYGIAYGVTGKSISEQATIRLAALNLKLTSEQGDQGVELWKKAFPLAGKFLNESARSAVTQGYTTSAWGRKRWFDLDYIRGNKWAFLAAQREGSNQRIQSTSADMTKLAMLYTHNMLNPNRGHIILSVHDEIVLEADEDYAEQAAYILKMGMETAAREILKNLGHTVIVEPSISDKYDK